MKKRSKNNNYLFYFFILLIIVMGVYALFPLFRDGFIVTDDGDWMIIRLTAFFQSLKEGQFPVRFLGRLNYNYGYPVANFLYPGFLYLGSLIHIVGFNFVDSVKIIIIFSFIGTGLFCYLWLSNVFGYIAGFGGALVTMLSPYMLFDLYKRGSVGEILAIFSATLIYFLIDRNIIYLLPYFIAFLILSHNTLAIFFMLCFVLYIFYKKDFRLFIPLLLGIGISSFFWMVVLLEKKYILFDTTKVSNPFMYFASQENINLLGPVSLLALLVLFQINKKIKKTKDLIFFVSLFFVSLFLTTPLSAPLWTNESISKFIQFPYRILSISILCLGYIVSFIINSISEKLKIFLVLIIIIYSVFNISYWHKKATIFYKPETFYSTNEATTTVADEYLPKWITIRKTTRANQKIEFKSGAGKISNISFSSQNISADIITENNSTIQINTIFYPGWGATINDIPTKIYHDIDTGLILIDLPSGAFKIKAVFRETPYRFTIDFVSLMFIILTIFYSSKVYVQKKNSKI